MLLAWTWRFLVGVLWVNEMTFFIKSSVNCRDSGRFYLQRWKTCCWGCKVSAADLNWGDWKSSFLATLPRWFSSKFTCECCRFRVCFVCKLCLMTARLILQLALLLGSKTCMLGTAFEVLASLGMFSLLTMFSSFWECLSADRITFWNFIFMFSFRKICFLHWLTLLCFCVWNVDAREFTLSVFRLKNFSFCRWLSEFSNWNEDSLQLSSRNCELNYLYYYFSMCCRSRPELLSR